MLDLNVVIAAHHPDARAGAEADASMVPGRFVPMHFRSRERNFPVAFVHWRERAKHRERVGLVMVQMHITAHGVGPIIPTEWAKKVKPQTHGHCSVDLKSCTLSLIVCFLTLMFHKVCGNICKEWWDF